MHVVHREGLRMEREERGFMLTEDSGGQEK